jgi:hypothetical protein
MQPWETFRGIDVDFLQGWPLRRPPIRARLDSSADAI